MKRNIFFVRLISIMIVFFLSPQNWDETGTAAEVTTRSTAAVPLDQQRQIYQEFQTLSALGLDTSQFQTKIDALCQKYNINREQLIEIQRKGRVEQWQRTQPTPTPSPVIGPSTYSKTTPTAQFNKEQVLFEDDFTDNMNNWILRDDKDALLKIENGKYILEGKQKDGWSVQKKIDLNQWKDFCIEVTLKKVTGDDNYRYSILWGRWNDNYTFYISNNGRYSYVRHDNSKSSVIKDWTKSSAIQRNSENTIMIKKMGERIQFFINNQFVYETHYEAMSGGALGFLVSNIMRIEIDHVIVKQPSAVLVDPIKPITFIPVTLKEGMEGFTKSSGALENSSEASRNKVFAKNQEFAKKAGIDLFKELPQYHSVGFKNGQFFLLFYNSARVAGCEKEYLIQRVKITKTFLNQNNEEAKPPEEMFLVEVFKINKLGELKRADEHHASYSIGNTYKRKTVVECEIGCGKIPKHIEGNKWPFEDNILFEIVQNYSPTPGLYNDVVFDFSESFKHEFEMIRDGRYSLTLPEFLSGY